MIISLSTHPNFDELTLSLEKLDALLKIASSANITEHEARTAFHYFGVAENILEKARNACESLAGMIVLSEKNHKTPML